MKKQKKVMKNHFIAKQDEMDRGMLGARGKLLGATFISCVRPRLDQQ